MSIAPTGDFSLEHLNEMNYLEIVIKESLRMYPQIPLMERQLIEPLELGR